jgi:hypoxanthine phosphoribosyltransferase
MDEKIEILFSSDAIRKRNRELASEIASDHEPAPLLVPVLKGSFMFAADLARELHAAGMAPHMDFITLASYYDGQNSSGRVELVQDIRAEVKGREVILLDDVLETGRTLAFARDLLMERGAGRVSVCVLVDKQVERASGIDIRADYRGFECGDLFLVGYGMDLGRQYRQLPHIGHVAN